MNVLITLRKMALGNPSGADYVKLYWSSASSKPLVGRGELMKEALNRRVGSLLSVYSGERRGGGGGVKLGVNLKLFPLKGYPFIRILESGDLERNSIRSFGLV